MKKKTDKAENKDRKCKFQKKERKEKINKMADIKRS